MTPSYGAYPVETDINGMPVQPNVVLATKGGKKLGLINNIGEKFIVQFNLNSPNEISFEVTKNIDGTECALWDSITDFKLIYVPTYRAWYEISVNTDEDAEGNVIKSVTATHLEEAELSQLNLYDMQINTEDDIDRDDYEPTVFYNPLKPKASLLHRLLADKASHYIIHHVDNSLRSIQRTFEFTDVSIFDALMDVAEEIGCLFLFGEAQDADGSLTRSISAYDLQTVCLNCGYRGDTVIVNGQESCPKCGSNNLSHGYGDDTSVFVSSENLAERLTYSGDLDSVKTCFKLEAGDELMTATVVNCNPNGTAYIWNIPEYMRNDMSPELSAALDDYDDLYAEYQTEHAMSVPQTAITKYNNLLTKYSAYKPELAERTITYPITGYTNLMNAYYDGLDLYALLETTLMPASPEVTETTAAEQAAQLTTAHLSPIAVTSTEALSVATANSVIVNYAKLFIDTTRYKLDVASSQLSSGNTMWIGVLNVTSYTDEEDTANSATLNIVINENLETFVQQKMDKALADAEGDDLSLSTLLFMPVSTTAEVNAFRAELNKYSLNALGIINSACDACLDVLIDNDCGSKTKSWTGDNLYVEMYQPMVKRSKQILAEIKERSNELTQLRSDGTTGKAILDYIEAARTNTRKQLSMQNFLGNTLWQELAAYRRDDTYSNSNYKSTDMTNSELIANAQQFLEVATHEIIKSSTQQHSITSTLQDLMVMPEFAPVIEHFELGNFIRVLIDETVYRLRLNSYQFDYSRIEDLNVTFTDVQSGEGFVSDVQSILAQARTMATSYDYVAHQASSGSEAQNQLQDWAQKGLDLTNLTIVSDASNQDVVINEQGIQLRRFYDDLGAYEEQQVKIINNGLYYTVDDWESVSAGIGHFQYADPSDNFVIKDGYGVIADTIVGNVILGNSVGIYNPNSTFSATADGVVIKANGNDGSSIFSIKDEDDNNLLNMTNDGQLDLVVNSFSLSSGETFYEKYATCTTAAGTAAKTVTCDGFVLRTGSRIAVYFTNANTAANPTLNVDDTVASPIWAKGAALTAARYWDAASLIVFTYDGSHWVMELDDQAELFKRLTNNSTTGTGNAQGVYLKNGKIYINASQIDTGTLNADLVTAGTMSAARIKGGTLTLGGSNNGNGVLSLQNASGTAVVTLNKDGITATAGTIGGFTIGGSAIYNGVTSMSDTAHDGVYLGTNGIRLGKGVFNVTTAGAVSASNLTITGGSITLGSTFKVTSGGAMTATSGKIGNFTIGTNSLIGETPMTSGTAATQYQTYLGSPASPAPSSVAIVVRNRSYNGSTYGATWNNTFRVRYDGLTQILANPESGQCISGSSLVNGTVHRFFQFVDGRLVLYRNEQLSGGDEETYWTGFIDSGLYSQTSTSHTRYMVMATHQNNIVGFATVSSSSLSATKSLMFFYDGLVTRDGYRGVMVCNRALYMQTCPIINGGEIQGTKFTTLSDIRLKKDVQPINDSVLERIGSVKLKQFGMVRDKNGGTHFGAIAQDVQNAMGGLSTHLISKVPSQNGDTTDEYLSLNYTEFLILRLAAAEKRIEKLERALLSQNT